MRILHLADLHWTKKKVADQKIVLGALLKDLSGELKQHRPIDFMIFSGDLAYSGDEREDFESAFKEFLAPIAHEAQIPLSRLILCPGNHDVSKKEIEANDYIELGLSAKLAGREGLNNLIDQYYNKDIDATHPINRLKNFFDFLRSSLHQDACFTSPFFDAFRFDIGGLKTGVAVFNTAWRSTGIGEKERHKLLLGERVVDLALSHLQNLDYRIAVLHHPLDWLAEWDKRAVEIRLIGEFNLILSGHTHHALPQFIQNTFGCSIHCQSGALYESRDYFNGYAIIEVNTEIDRIVVHSRTYFDSARRFGAAENLVAGGRVELPLASALGARLSPAEMRALRDAVEDRADRHVRTLLGSEATRFEHVFTCPPLSRMREADIKLTDDAIARAQAVTLDEMLSRKGVIIISGSRESGKTTLSLQVARMSLDAPKENFRVPVFVNFNKLKKYSSAESLFRQSSASLGVDITFKKVHGVYRLLFIVDNVSIGDTERLECLSKLIHDNKDAVDWLILLDEGEIPGERSVIEKTLGEGTIIFIHQLKRTQIRAAVGKIPTRLNNHNEIEETVIRLISENELPRTHYIVCLLVFAILANKAGEAINEANLVENMIDVLLERARLNNIIRSSVDFHGQNIALEHIAEWINQEGGFIHENDLLRRVSMFYSERGINAGAADVINRFLATGILERKADEISFRFRAFQSFFLARRALKSTDLRDSFIRDRNIILYQRELMFLCDIARDESYLLEHIGQTVLRFQPKSFNELSSDHFLTIHDISDTEELLDAHLERVAKGPMTAEEIDELADFADRAAEYSAAQIEKRRLEKSDDEIAKENIEKGLDFVAYISGWQVWGRALSSLDFVELNIKKPTLTQMLSQWSYLASLFARNGTDHLEYIRKNSRDNGKPVSEKRIKVIEYILRTQLPLLLLRMAFFHLGSRNIQKLIADTFDELPAEAPETVGAALLLILHRPDGWSDRVREYAKSLKGQTGHRVIIRMLLAACFAEYRTTLLSNAEMSVFEELMADLLVLSGVESSRRGRLVSKLRERRSLTMLKADKRN